VWTSSLSRASASLEAILETMARSAAMALCAEIADRVVVASQLLRRRQGTQYLANFAERAFDACQRRIVDAALTGVVNAAGQRADFIFDRFDRLAWHRLGNGVTNFGQFAAECGDRLLDAVRMLQRLDLARDLDQMALERGKIGPRRRFGHDRRCAARQQRSWRGTVEFALARGDLRHGEVERCGADRRRGAIDLGSGALNQVVLVVRKLGWFGRHGIGDLRQPRVEARDGFVQLPGDNSRLAAHGVVAKRLAVRRRARDLLDLAGDRIQPLVNVQDVRGLPDRRHRRLIGGTAKAGRGGIADGGIEPVAERHASAPRGGLGPLANGWIDALYTPR
jgi:hypothetical protein